MERDRVTMKLLRWIVRFFVSEEVILENRVSDKWIKDHMYESGKEKKD